MNNIAFILLKPDCSTTNYWIVNKGEDQEEVVSNMLSSYNFASSWLLLRPLFKPADSVGGVIPIETSESVWPCGCS